MKKIMIVDDSRPFLMYLGLLMKRMKYKIIPAEDGVELLSLLKFTRPDAILLDLNMPMMDGLKALKLIREAKQTSSIPVIMLTTDASSVTMDKCNDLGCYAYLTKPVQIDKLHYVLEECFYSHRKTNRKHLRETCIRKVPVVYRGKLHEFYSEVLSEGGIYLRTLEPFPVGADVELTLALSEEKQMLLKGDVIYEKKVYGDFLNVPPGMAIRFKGLTGDQTQILKNFMEDLLARDILESQEEPVIETSRNRTFDFPTG